MNPIELDYLTPQKKKTSRLARLALICAIAPCCLCCGVMARDFGDEAPYGSPNWLQNAAGALIILGGPIAAVVLGTMALRQMKRDPLVKGKGLAYCALILGSCWILYLGLVALLSCLGIHPT